MNVVNVWVNGERRELAPGITLERLLAELFPAYEAGAADAAGAAGAARVPGVAAALNETVIPRGQWPGTTLAEGDRVEVLTAVQGG
jgi:sulfur carrier protein